MDDKEGQFDAGSAQQMIDFELGRLDLVRESAAREQGLAEATRLAPYLWAAAAMQVMLALHDGRFAEAEVLLAGSLELGLRSQETMAEAGHALQLYELQAPNQAGRTRPKARWPALPAENPTRPLFGCALARLETDLGRQAGARKMFQRLAEDNFRAVPRDQEWLLAMSFLADVCTSLDDPDRGAMLYDQLLPYADRMAVGACTRARAGRSRGGSASSRRCWAVRPRLSAISRLLSRSMSQPEPYRGRRTRGSNWRTCSSA